MVSVGPFDRKGILIITLAQQAKTRTHLNTLDMQSPRSSGANNFIDVDDCASYWDWETQFWWFFQKCKSDHVTSLRTTFPWLPVLPNIRSGLMIMGHNAVGDFTSPHFISYNLPVVNLVPGTMELVPSSPWSLFLPRDFVMLLSLTLFVASLPRCLILNDTASVSILYTMAPPISYSLPKHSRWIIYLFVY